MLGLGGQLLMVTSDAVASGGSITVGVTPPLRAARSIGAAVTWDKPTALFLLAAPETRATWQAKVSPGISVDLVEVFA